MWSGVVVVVVVVVVRAMDGRGARSSFHFASDLLANSLIILHCDFINLSNKYYSFTYNIRSIYVCYLFVCDRFL
jgi:hypothetical protein